MYMYYIPDMGSSTRVLVLKHVKYILVSDCVKVHLEIILKFFSDK